MACISNISRNTKSYHCKFSVSEIYTFKWNLFSAITTLCRLSAFNSRSEAIELFLLKQGNNDITLSIHVKQLKHNTAEHAETQLFPPTQWSKEQTCQTALRLVEHQWLFKCLCKNRGLLLVAPPWFLLNYLAPQWLFYIHNDFTT